MKRIILLILVTMFLFVGCTNTAVLSANISSAETATSSEQTSTTSNALAEPEACILKEQKEVIAKENSSEDMTKGLESDEMYLYYKTNFELKNKTATVELYIDSQVEEDGTLFYDHVHGWSLLVRQGDYVYPLISKQKVFNGQIKYALFTDIGDPTICIVVFIQTDAGMEIYEYQFHDQEQTFTRKRIYKTIYADTGYYSKGDIPYIPKY